MKLIMENWKRYLNEDFILNEETQEEKLITALHAGDLSQALYLADVLGIDISSGPVHNAIIPAVQKKIEEVVEEYSISTKFQLQVIYYKPSEHDPLERWMVVEGDPRDGTSFDIWIINDAAHKALCGGDCGDAVAMIIDAHDNTKTKISNWENVAGTVDKHMKRFLGT